MSDPGEGLFESEQLPDSLPELLDELLRPIVSEGGAVIPPVIGPVTPVPDRRRLGTGPAEEQPAPPAEATAPAYHDRVSGPPAVVPPRIPVADDGRQLPFRQWPPPVVDTPGSTPPPVPANKRMERQYDEIERVRAALYSAFDSADPEAFVTELARYTRALLDGVRTIQAPMWGPKYTVDPRTLAPDDFLDVTIGWRVRKDHAAQAMERARKLR